MELFSFLQVDSDLTAWFILDGQEYEMSRFDINFAQSVDHKGQPQDEVRYHKRFLKTFTDGE